ncbi:MAG: hypothetical protein JNM68_13870 [Dinghuibacter sp.]|nr:hypothetical protein [Dinghuibacter sp.]
MKKVAYWAIAAIFLCLTPACNRRDFITNKVKEVVIFNTTALNKPTLNMTSADVLNCSKLVISNRVQLDLIKNARKKNGVVLWKGSVKGIVVYEDGATENLRISDYGGFFMKENEQQVYQVVEGRDAWEQLLDSFLGTAIP